jgi:FAD/FMN-containing dehydrogenase
VEPFNLAVAQAPELVVGATSPEDVAEAVRFAAEHGLGVSVQTTGHGAQVPITGLMITTRRLDAVSVDPEAKTATVGGGVRWGAVIEAAAEHGLAPITGSSPNVSVVGFIAGGGLGPLARSHGFGSDYLEALTVVTGTGEILTADADQNQELLWAFRGGKPGIGVVTEATVRLIELPALYAGAMYFAEDDIEQAFRAWIDWTKNTDPRVTTSVSVARFPGFDAVPEPLRGRTLLVLRFAFPGPAEEGEALAAPMREAAPVYLDMLAEMPATDVARIHNDPTDPGPAYLTAAMLNEIDQDFATAFLGNVGAGTNPPFVGAEVRHVAGASATDVPEGSAVGGRGAPYTMGQVANRPETFETEVPAAVERLYADLEPWIADETSINFAGTLRSDAHFASAWPGDTFARIAELRKKYDPDGIVDYGYIPS